MAAAGCCSRCPADWPVVLEWYRLSVTAGRMLLKGSGHIEIIMQRAVDRCILPPRYIFLSEGRWGDRLYCPCLNQVVHVQIVLDNPFYVCLAVVCRIL